MRVAALGKARGPWVTVSTADRTRVITLSDMVNHDGTNAKPAVPTGNIVVEAATFVREVWDTTDFGAGTTWNTLASLSFSVAQPCKIIVFGKVAAYSYPLGTLWSYGRRIVLTASGGGSDTRSSEFTGYDIPPESSYGAFPVEAGTITIDLGGYLSTGHLIHGRIFAMVSLR